MSATLQITAILSLLGIFVAVLMVAWKRDARQPITERLEDLAGPEDRTAPQARPLRNPREALPKVVAFLSPVAGAERHRLKNELVRAGLYRPTAMTVYLGVKLMMMLGPVLVGLVLALLQVLTLRQGLVYGTIASGVGLVGPGLWLKRRTAARQLMIRRAIPDFLDVVVICLDAGLSFQAALLRVHGELAAAFPLFSFELNIVLHEIQLGMSTGEALQRFAARSDMQEVRSFAAVVTQSERYGASLTKALHVHARSLRLKRAQWAEEKGQQASVKIIFPTILFIFPAVFLVILGPAMIQIYAMMTKLK
jgi:tight adherence protein C